MTTQPEALRLADDLAKYLGGNTATKAAAELRRLVAEHEEDQRVIAVWRGRTQRAEAQRDAMQERAEYWKRKHDDEETGAERYALRVQRDELLAALRVFVSCALPVSTKIDERGHRWTEAYLDQALLNARAAIKAVKEGE